MVCAFFSDVHANLPALDAVLKDIDERNPDMVFCLGDLVGYATWPNEVVETIRRRRIPTIAGNYDEGVGLGSDDCGCAYKTVEDEARGSQSISWTNSVITDANREYLRTLPRHIRVTLESPRDAGGSPAQILLVHGSPRKINEYLFEDRPDTGMLRMMETADADVMLFGHTHKPYQKRLAATNGHALYRYAINIGSVGKPKDGDPRACYVIMDATTRKDGLHLSVDFVRVPYDVETAAAAVEQSPLPSEFAEMLRKAY